jgi:hypothetical protein
MTNAQRPPPWLIYLLQVIGLIVLGGVALRFAPRKSALDDLLQNATATVRIDGITSRPLRRIVLVEG